GTHKAMILDWLRLQGRENEKTKTYGYTRSWSKLGSAVSVIIAAGLVYYTGRYSDIFWLAIVPYCLSIVNFLGYPAELDGRSEQKASLGNVLRHLMESLRQVLRLHRLRRVLLESMGYESACKVAGDYLQPILKQLAMGLPVLLALGEDKRTALLVGPVYFVLHAASSVASRRSHKVVDNLGGEGRAASRMWQLTFAIFASLTVALLTGTVWPAVVLFVVLELARNIWRPITITRVDNETEAGRGATMMSIESQAKALGTMLLAPVAGLAVDRFAMSEDAPAFWVVGVIGLLVCAVGAVMPAMAPPTPSDHSETSPPQK
ncbi:MAG TPA: hypothetical protein QGH10_07410, partial [Armatimonadota bacterium]|nr:hypothetical protein [Armatimonadota bacterium]